MNLVEDADHQNDSGHVSNIRWYHKVKRAIWQVELPKLVVS